MSQFSFPEVRHSVFELHTQPQLFYLRRFGSSDSPRPPQALHTHQDLVEIIFIEEGILEISGSPEELAKTSLRYQQLKAIDEGRS